MAAATCRTSSAINSSRPQNLLPYQRRGIDFSLGYSFPLNRAFENLPGNVALTVRATRALEIFRRGAAVRAVHGADLQRQVLPQRRIHLATGGRLQ